MKHLTRAPLLTLALWAAMIAGCSSPSSSGGGGNTIPPPPPVTQIDCPVARVASSAADLVPGPVARGVLGDLVLENTKLRAIVQKGGRNWYNISQFGGNIIDALPKDSAGELIGLDNYEEAALGTNIESSPNYQTVQVLQPGGKDSEGNCLPAIVRASGPDDLLDFVNGSSAIEALGFSFPASADDFDLDMSIQTDYVLNPGASYVEMQTRLINNSSTSKDIYMVEYANGSGEVESFQYGYGFGEPLVTAPCDSCRALIYAGHDGAVGVSYGLIHNFSGTTSVSVSGVAVMAYGADATQLFVTGEQAVPPNYTVPGDGELEFTRWFAVVPGGVADVLAVQYEILGQTTGNLAGIVLDSSGTPVSNAEIAVITSNNDFEPLLGTPRGPDVIVASHFRTDVTGRFLGKLPPGTYELRANVPGRLAGEAFVKSVDIVADETTTTEFIAPRASTIRVLVVDENNQPVAAKVQLIGTDSSPDAGEPQNGESILGQINVSTGVFGDFAADKLAPGIVFSEFAVKDNGSGNVTLGDTGVFAIEPGDYQLSVSHGPRYSEFTQDITVTEGQLSTATARVVRVVETPNIVFGDFHVHSFDSPDSEVTNRERVATYLAEDMDFFTPSDHGMRVDFEPVIADMGVASKVASAPSAEITSFDYGHFNAWPVQIDTSPASSDEPSQSGDPKIGQGSVDWGGVAPAGQDFPSAGHYSVPPAGIFADAKNEPFTPSRETVVQINHVDSHFGADGLEIDTGVSPPQSNKDLSKKRLDAANISNGFSDGFDTLELWIGVDGRVHQFEHFLGENAPDWFNLLNQGILKTFVSNSDTHDRRLTSLSTRNYISVPASMLTNGKPNLTAIRSDPHTVGDAVIEGYTVGSNSLYLNAKLRNAAGDVAGLEQSDDYGTRSRPMPLATPGEETTLSVDVQAPTWAVWDEIQVFVNGHTVRHTDQLGQATEPARYSLCAAAQTVAATPAAVDVSTIDTVTYQRLESSNSLSIPSPGQDYWLVVLVQGKDGVSPPLWPVVPNDFTDSGDGLATRSAADIGTTAMAMSNPIYVDADGDGLWTPPGVENTTHTGSNLPPDQCP